MSRTSLLSAAQRILPLLLCLLIGCSRGREAADAFTQDLGRASGKLEVGQELRMDTVNKGDWNRMFVFPPYTPISKIESALKIKASSAIKSAGVSERDDINLFIFLNGENIQLIAAVPRKIIDLSVGKEVQPLNRSRSVFKKVSVDEPLILAAGI